MKKGHIEQRGKKFRARKGKRSLGTFDNRDAAAVSLEGGTLAALYESWLLRRRKLGYADVDNDESRWELYFARDPVAHVPLVQLGRRQALEWLARMVATGLFPQTIKNARNVASSICADAVDFGLMAANPFRGMRLPRSVEARTHEGWTILDPDEQLALLDAVDPDEYHLVAFALHTGLRNSELWWLHLEDIDLEASEVVVRRGKKGKAPKSGKIRRTPLIGLAYQSAHWAINNRRSKFAWPSPRTKARRYESSQPSRWDRWVERAGIKRHVRFYDLRHTCATSLLAGWWGRKWSLDEVRQMLGHSSIKVTERYAHLIDDTLRRAARDTVGLEKRPQTGRGARANSRDRTEDLRFTNAWVEERFHALTLVGFHGVALRRHWRRVASDELSAAVIRGLDAAFAGDRQEYINALECGALLLDGDRARSEAGRGG